MRNTLPIDGPLLTRATTATQGTICKHPIPMRNTLPIDGPLLTRATTATQGTICKHPTPVPIVYPRLMPTRTIFMEGCLNE